MRPLQHPSHKVRLTQDFHQDLQWWQAYLRLFNCRPISRFLTNTVHIQSDACNLGGGALRLDGDWFYVDWQYDLPRFKNCHINVKEALSVIFGLFRWAPTLRDSLVIVETDNIFTRAAINRGACRNSILMPYLRQLWWLIYK